jgi:hypothetical protein
MRVRKIMSLIVAALILGMASTVAVAWVIALLPPPQVTTDSEFVWKDGVAWAVASRTGRGRLAVCWDSLGSPPGTGTRHQSRLVASPEEAVGEMRIGVLPPRISEGTGPLRVDHATGWPALALWCQTDAASHRNNLDPRWHGGIALGRAAGQGSFVLDALPMRPLWRGLAINSLFYASAWLLILLLLRGGRRYLARQRNQRFACANCGYLRQGLPARACCPECGAPELQGAAPTS